MNAAAQEAHNRDTNAAPRCSLCAHAHLHKTACERAL